MDGLTGTNGSRQRPHAGYALVEIVIELGLAAIAAVGRAASAVMRAQQMARVRREMHGLSDHYLRDIGLNHGDIERIFR